MSRDQALLPITSTLGDLGRNVHERSSELLVQFSSSLSFVGGQNVFS